MKSFSVQLRDGVFLQKSFGKKDFSVLFLDSCGYLLRDLLWFPGLRYFRNDPAVVISVTSAGF